MKPLVCPFILLFIGSFKCCKAIEDDLIVRVEQGLVKGIKETSLGGKEFYSYMSVPYAKPPVDDLRFKDPVALESWQGILNATTMPEYCPQYSIFEIMKKNKSSLFLQGQEDCLYLNVFTPKPNKPHSKLPVMLYIHGGGFFCGGAKETPPYVLLNEEIVLVVIQYRLGILGFLSTEDSVLPGNMGLKDQQLALKWVHENILHFGGDPERITIFGESAGGASTHMHMLSPGSKGLFQRVISQSGTVLCPWAFNENHRSFAVDIGNTFHCSLDDEPDSYVKCLQNIDATHLSRHMAEGLSWGITPLFVLPRVDGDFFPEKPEILLKEGRYNKVDFMSGLTRDDGALVMILMHINPSLVESLNSDFEVNGPLSLYLTNEPNSEKLATEIYQHYLQKKTIKITSEDEEQLLKLYTDRYFAMCHEISSAFHAKDEEISVYLYQLNHKGQRSFTDVFQAGEGKNWISHVDDMFYLFSGGPLFFNPLEREEDLKLREIMVSLWTNFARTGNPTPPGSDFIWEKATNHNFKHLSLLPNPKMENDYKSDMRKFWLSVKTKQIVTLFPDGKLYLDEKEKTSEERKQEL